GFDKNCARSALGVRVRQLRMSRLRQRRDNARTGQRRTKMRIARVLRAGLASIALGASFGALAQQNVQALADRWAQAYNRHDRAALGELYAEAARLLMHGSPTIAGRSAIEACWAADMEDRNPLTLLDVTHPVSGSDMMLVHGDYRVITRD